MPRTRGHIAKEKGELSVNQVQVEQKNYQMPPLDGFTSRTFSPSPTLSDLLVSTRRCSAVEF